MGGKLSVDSSSENVADVLEELGSAYKAYREQLLAEGDDGELLFTL